MGQPRGSGGLREAVAAAPYLAFAEVIQSRENGGFTGGVNLGVARALELDPHALWLLNPDTVPRPGTLEELLVVLEASSAAVVSPLVLEPLGTWAGERHFAREFAGPWSVGKPRPGGGRWWRSGRYHGSCALFRAEAVRRLLARDGQFQRPGLFMYWDEWECSGRLGRLPAAIAGNCVVSHGPTGLRRMPGWREYYLARNAVLVARARLPVWQWLPLLGVRLARDTAHALRWRLTGRSSELRAYSLGTLDGLRGIEGRWGEHRE